LKSIGRLLYRFPYIKKDSVIDLNEFCQRVVLMEFR